MKDHTDCLPKDLELIDMSLEGLKEYGDSDSTLNYLYFLRDEINARIKKEKKSRAQR